MDKLRRVFFAFMPDAAVRDSLSALRNTLTGTVGANLRWLPTESWHVTARFVGPASDTLAEALYDCAAMATRRYLPLEIRFQRIELFPSPQRPSVLAATSDASSSLRSLAALLERQCVALGLPAQPNSWRCHMSLARTKDSSSVRSMPVTIDLGFTAKRLHLLESLQTNKQPCYRSIELTE